MQPINWEHLIPTIGMIYDTRYVDNDPEDNVPYIMAAGIIWAHKYPEYAKEMIRRHEMNSLLYSMETKFAMAECSVCHESYGKDDEYCSHLKWRRAGLSDASRILHDIRFTGGGVTRKPADKDAVNMRFL
jgi:hypothetical protein